MLVCFCMAYQTGIGLCVSVLSMVYQIGIGLCVCVLSMVYQIGIGLCVSVFVYGISDRNRFVCLCVFVWYIR